MGKQGPCYHCGVSSTPLWRNGPPEKPILCNACGSRWRTKGTLANYTPLHARTEPNDYEDQRVSRLKIVSVNKNKEVKLVKREQNHDNAYAASGWLNPEYNHGFLKAVDEDTSNRSSSGSAISNSESCVQFGGIDPSDLTGASQSVVWDTVVPSKKRTCAGRLKHSSVEKLTKELCNILHEQQQQSCFSASSEEELLYENEAPMVSVEIGHGSMLIRHPSSIARDEESEASSLSVDNKQCLVNEAYSCYGSIPMLSDYTSMNFSSRGVAKIESSAGKRMQQEKLERNNSQLEKLEVLENHDSSLFQIELKDAVNYEEFSRNLTDEEQQQLLKYLPVVDTAKLPDREGVFDSSLLGDNPEDRKTPKRLALSNLSKSKWVEHYNHLKSGGNKAGKCDDMESPAVESSNFANVKRLRVGQNQNFPELKATMRSPKRVIIKASSGGKEIVEGSSISDGKEIAEGSNIFVDESTDHDLLLDFPSNNSFPQAELLLPTSSSVAQGSTSSSSVHSRVTRP
ncbi:GATA transcription factor 26-like [Vicia villosa]|uniref:GATA transcription factor 26-like n=1 Tax=Vicia villosa TaxID=3911 RepID=UPI00273C6793|nr:GATA transcription factor 26-like [Vicia villosa]